MNAMQSKWQRIEAGAYRNADDWKIYRDPTYSWTSWYLYTPEDDHWDTATTLRGAKELYDALDDEVKFGVSASDAKT